MSNLLISHCSAWPHSQYFEYYLIDHASSSNHLTHNICTNNIFYIDIVLSRQLIAIDKHTKLITKCAISHNYNVFSIDTDGDRILLLIGVNTIDSHNTRLILEYHLQISENADNHRIKGYETIMNIFGELFSPDYYLVKIYNISNDDYELGSKNINLKINVNKLSVSEQHALILCNEYGLFSFGHDYYGELGLGLLSSQQQYTNVLIPTKVIIPNYDIPIDISSTSFFSLCITSNGSVYTFGYGIYYRNCQALDNNNTIEFENYNIPTKLKVFEDIGCKAKLCTCNLFHIVIVDEINDVYTWGWNKFNQMGLSTGLLIIITIMIIIIIIDVVRSANI